MIVSRPNFNAVFAISLFLIICFTLGILNLNIILKGGDKWYNYLIVFLTIPLGLSVLIKQMIEQ